MQKKPRKLIAHIPGLDGKAGFHEYFIVQDTERMGAVATLVKARPDLVEARIEVKGEASQDFLDWLQPEPGRDVFQIMVLS
jgi:hypothetical protein